MKSSDIRKTFLEFFEKKGHKLVPSASLIPADPTVLLTLAGMLPFKPIFLGVEKPEFPRAASCQKCVRMNDIEEVGKTTRHHTFFEMLGNFSFGDPASLQGGYFKKEAIAYAWELLTQVYKVPADKLQVAVFEKDDDAAEIWVKDIKFPAERIHRLGEDNNFWAAGPTGPCGPCSEIYYDFGPEAGCGRPDCKPGCDCDRFLEIWNLVFIQYNRNTQGALEPLQAKSIDTGMGLERISRVLQGVKSNFDTDLFKPIIDKIASQAKGNPDRKALCVVADHLRAMTYLIADGIYPSNEKRGYVARRIIRRAVVYGRKLGIEGAFLYKLAPQAIEMGQSVYPELKTNRQPILDLIQAEEENFEARLNEGLKLIQELLAKYQSAKIIPGAEAFKLHDTFGFPIELTQEIAAESGFSVDLAGFKSQMDQQKELARAGQKGQKDRLLQALKLAEEKFKKTEFTGYDKSECDTKVLGVLPEYSAVALEKTPFYPEGGGQVADTGIIRFDNHELIISGAYGKIGGVIVHQVNDLGGLKAGQKVKVILNSDRRALICRHHTATHLLQAALRSIIGPEVKQAGSFVGPDRLRFDFTSPQALTAAQILQVEKFVNQKIKEKLPVKIALKNYQDAVKQGAMALFGEKYGDRVRVVAVPGTSLELCGGCHARQTGDLEFFKIIKEEALQAGVRRIEAVAGQPARISVIYRAKELRDHIFQLMERHQQLEQEKSDLGGEGEFESSIFAIDEEEINRISKAVDTQDLDMVNRFFEHLEGRVDWLEERNRKLVNEIEKLKASKAADQSVSLLSQVKEIAGKKVLIAALEKVEMPHLRVMAEKIRSGLPSGAIALVSVFDDKVIFLATLSDDLIAQQMSAGEIIKLLAEVAGGKGGGRPSKAEGGGKDPSKVKEALEKLEGYFSK